MGLLDWLFKTNKKPKKKERDKWARQAEKAKRNTQSNSKRKSASYKSDTAKRKTTQRSTTSSTSSRKGRNSSSTQRWQSEGKRIAKRQKQYNAYKSRQAVKTLEQYTGHKYKNNEQIKPSIYTGDPESYREYRINANAIDKNADKTVYDAKTGTAKGQTIKEYFSAPEHQKEAQKQMEQDEKFINEHPFWAGVGNAHTKLVNRGVEDLKDIYSNVKGKDGKKGIDTEKYDKSTAAKVGNVVGVASQYITPSGLANKVISKTATKGAVKATTKALAKNKAKKLTKDSVKNFAKRRTAEVAADMPLDVAHSYKDSKGDKKEFAKQMRNNIILNVGVGGGAEYLGKGVKALKDKAVTKSAIKKATKNSKETAKAVKGALESLDNRAKEQGDYLSDLRTKMGVKTKSKAVKGKPVTNKSVKEVTMKNTKTGKTVTGKPRNKEEMRIMLRSVSQGADNASDIKITSKEVQKGTLRTRDNPTPAKTLRQQNAKALADEDALMANGANKATQSVEDAPKTATANRKSEQLKVIQKNNPAPNDDQAWVRSEKDILTYDEALKDSDWDGWDKDGFSFSPDYTGKDAQKAVKNRKVTVYSSREIKDGEWVTPSRMEAESYSGDGKVFSKEVDLDDVAWVDPTQGQYAKVAKGETVSTTPKKTNSNKAELPTKDLEEISRAQRDIEQGLTGIKDADDLGYYAHQHRKGFVGITKDDGRSVYWFDDLYRELHERYPNQFPYGDGIDERKVVQDIMETDTTPAKPSAGEPSAKPPKEEPPESDIDKEWKAKGKEYGTYDKAKTPKKTDEETKVPKALDTATSKKPGKEGIVQDERVEQNIKRSVLEQEVGFTQRSQQEALDAAYKRVAKDPEAVRKQVNETLTAKDSDIANGVALYDHYMKLGDIEAASDVLAKVSLQLTEAGRTTNAAKMLMRATPAGRVRSAQRLAEKLTERYGKRLKGDEITLSDDTIKRINDAKTEKEILEANEAAAVEIWNQIPASWGEKFNSWRYIAMLANPKTHIRNIIGNALFAVPREVKNIIGTGVETLAEKAGLIQKGERTKALINYASKSDQELLEFGGKSFDVNEPILRNQSRWSDSARHIDSKVFNNPILEKLRKVNGGVLDKGDILFMKPAYRKAMARYMKANGYKASDMTGDVLKKAEAVASNEALKATYRDANAFASWLTKTKNVAPDATLPRKLGAVAVESMVPFAKTPTNILRRGIEYSPVGLMQGMTSIGRALARKDGRMLVQAIDQMAAGLTGTGVLGLGYLLNKNGLVTVEISNDSEGNFRKGLGEQSYALKFGDSSFTLDWAAPMSMPFFVGANISDQTKNDDLSLKDVLNSLGDMMNPVAEMSMLQGLTSTLGAVRSSKSGGAMLEDVVLGIGTNYLSQAVPTISGQLARIFDNTQRSTTSTEEGNAMRKLDKFQKQMRAKVPGLSRTLEPALDSWGNEKKYGSTTERVLENFVSPGYYSENKATPVDKNLLKLAGELGDDEKSKIFPKGLTGYNLGFNGKDVRVTPQALTLYNKVKGKEAYKKVKDLMQSDEYKNMSKTDKVKAITNIYTDAGVWAKQESLIKMGKDKFKVRTDDWENEDAIKAAKEYNGKHDIDDIVNINKQLDDLGFSTSRNRQTNIKAIAVAESDKENKDLYKYYNVDKDTQKTIKQYQKSGGNLKELGAVQKSIDVTAKTVGKRANELPKGALAYALSAASGKNRIYQMYDESTPLSKGYWEHSVRSGQGMAATGLTLKDRQKAYDATKGASGHPSRDAIVKYLDKKNWTQEQKSYMFWQLANWNTKENPYGDYTPKFKAKKTTTTSAKGKSQIDYTTPEAKEFFNNFGANMSKERMRVGEKLYKTAKTSVKGINAPYSNDKDYLPKETLQVVSSRDKKLESEALKALKSGGLKNIIKTANKTLPKVKEPEDSDTIYGDGKEGSSSGGGGGYYRRYGRGGRGGRGGSGGGSSATTTKPVTTTRSTSSPNVSYNGGTWTPTEFRTKAGWTNAQIRKVFNTLIKQGLTEQQAVSRIASLWNTRFS